MYILIDEDGVIRNESKYRNTLVQYAELIGLTDYTIEYDEWGA